MDPSTTDARTLAERKQDLYASAPLHPAGDLAAWQSTVLFAPHPDDEALGCGGLIRLLTGRGQVLRIVFVSDGGMSHPHSTKFSRADRVALREEEARAACGHLGVAADHIHFLRLPDGEVPGAGQEEFAEAVARVAELVRSWAVDTFVVPWRRDVHEDHLATWDICRAVADQASDGLRWVEYPVWMWQTGNQVDLPRAGEMIPWALDVADLLTRKEEAIRLHASQWNGRIDDDPSGFQLPDEMIGLFLRPREIYLEPADKRERSLDSGYFDAVYAAADDPWQFETSDYERNKYDATLAALPEERYNSALEIGCSIGVLTARLATRCDRLLAVDISDAALARARARVPDSRVTFRRMELPGEFPDERFDLVVISEVGYYWSYADLERAIDRIQQATRPGGTLVLVHYTPYVPDYPLTGDEVHEAFSRKLEGFHRVHQSRAARYRMDVWKKKGSPRPTA
ncbi:bifunctional PIG-L family deacetylase/class I SAM-dependent methyltransferase [Lewinella sp. IMCC34183]|uniref:bifunctional PIG-L family deacetylase/class I SAM-dependent methyltransferase n=1 Tax=Lewinella sp. IMCC34183 TaxID=2248762 RepID=UPI000E27DADE|nr:bifunctional PIG-L family deacetylase/class I SAM-dependent methyltransferase [Lewinella sp. IMCC34183]